MNRRNLLKRAVLFTAGLFGISFKQSKSEELVKTTNKKFEFGRNIEVQQIKTWNSDKNTKRFNAKFPCSDKRRLVILQKDYMKTLYPQIDRLNENEWVEQAVLYLDQDGYGMLVGFSEPLSMSFASKPFTESKAFQN